MFKKLDNKTKENILRRIPTGKTGDIQSIYNAIKFIIYSNYVNGAEIAIDGGFDG
jgi:NAD(P)-dependent dehydrogenase (short-subunit alcohol dehydrogenase family)